MYIYIYIYTYLYMYVYTALRASSTASTAPSMQRCAA